MFLVEPGSTPFDLHFQIFRIPVRVHPFFWIVGILFGVSDNGGVADVLLSIGAVFVSILVHELGHAITMVRYGDSPRIVLYAMGGLAIPDRSNVWNLSSGQSRGAMQQIIISAAGPLAGFLFAAVILGVTLAAGGRVNFNPKYLSFAVGGFRNELMSLLIMMLLHFNVFWGLVNLLPVYPLDGGQIAHQILITKDPWAGMRKTLQLSAVVGIIAAVVGFLHFRSQFMALLFASLAVSAFMGLKQMGGPWGGGQPW